MRGRGIFWAIFVVTLASRLALLAAMGKQAGVEEHLHENWVIAENLLAGRGYSLNGVGPTAHKPPVYPLFLVLMIRVFGEQPFLAIRIVQSFVFAAGATAAFAVFRYLVSDRLALLATGLIVISPFLRKLHIWIDSVSMSMVLILVVLLLAIGAQRDAGRKRAFVWLGIASGLMTLTLPATLGLVPVIVLWLFFNLPRPTRRWSCGLFLATFVLALVPWSVRNAVAFGRFMPLSSNFKLELWIGNNPDANGGMENSQRKTITEPRGALGERVARLSEVERYDVLGHEALKYIWEHPGRFVVLRVKSFFYFLCTQSYWMEDDHSLGRILAKLAVVAQAVLAIAGCAAALWRRVPYAALLAGCAAAFASVYTLTHADIGDRYRLPIDPLLIFFCVYAVLGWWRPQEPTAEPIQPAPAEM